MIKQSVAIGELWGTYLFVFTDNILFNRIFLNRTSSFPLLFEIILVDTSGTYEYGSDTTHAAL